MVEPTIHPRGLLSEPNVDRTQSPAPSQQQQQQSQQQPPGLTIDELGAALRLTTSEPLEEPIRLILERQLRIAEAAIDGYAPGADTFSRNEAIIRMIGFLVDGPSTALNNAPQQDAFAMSGAKSLLSRWRVQKGVTVV